jgi:hypothetical protein
MLLECLSIHDNNLFVKEKVGGNDAMTTKVTKHQPSHEPARLRKSQMPKLTGVQSNSVLGEMETKTS